MLSDEIAQSYLFESKYRTSLSGQVGLEDQQSSFAQQWGHLVHRWSKERQPFGKNEFKGRGEVKELLDPRLP